jgi:hypothetical protein
MNPIEIEKQIMPYLIKLAESPPVQAEIETAKTAIISIIESQSLSIFQRIVRWIRNKFTNKKGECINMADETTNTTATTTTEEATTLSTITDAAKDAAITTAATTLATTTTQTSTDIADSINERIKALTEEISKTSSPWVKIRDTAEIAALAGALAGLVTGLTKGLESLKDKIS